MKKTLFYIALLLLFPQMAQAAQGMTIESIINNLFAGGHLFSISRIMEAVAYLSGIGMGIKGILKLQDWSESKGKQTKLSVPLIYITCAGMLLGLPTMIQVGAESFLGNGAATQFNSSSGQYGGQY